MEENSDGNDTNVGSIENSIEEAKRIIEKLISTMKSDREMFDEKTTEKEIYTFFINALEFILSDYKRVLEINEVLLKENEELKFEERSRIIGKYGDTEIHDVINRTLSNDYIPVQKLKDIIDRIDYDIKKTKEIISKNTNINASYRKNDYQIVRLRAMNTKSLDIKNRLQKLLESEE